MPPVDEWYPAQPGARITVEGYDDPPSSSIAESGVPMNAPMRTWGLRFQGSDSSPGYDLSPEVVEALNTDGGPRLQHGQPISAERLNTAAERVGRVAHP